MKNSKRSHFTLIIPTFNRPEYLKRLLGYYNQQNTDFKIIVADSSSQENKLKNKEIIDSFLNLKVLYLNHFSEDLHPFNKQLFALGKVETEYCAICPDDDFIMIKPINYAIDFFEKNPDFTCVHGRYVRFYLKGKGNKRRFYWHFIYDMKSIVDSDPQKRVDSYTTNSYNILFATYRTSFLKMIMEESEKYAKESSFFGELLQNILPFIYGNMKTLDIIYSPKDAMSTPKNTNINHFHFLSDYKKDGTFAQRYSLLLECLSKHLSHCSGKSMEEAKKSLNLILSSYFEEQGNTISLNLASSFHKIRVFLERIRTPSFLYALIRWPYQKLFIQKGIELNETIPDEAYYEELRKLKEYLITFN